MWFGGYFGGWFGGYFGPTSGGVTPPVTASEGDGGPHGGGKGGRQGSRRYDPYEYRGPQGGPDPIVFEPETPEPDVGSRALEIATAEALVGRLAAELASLKAVGADFAVIERELARQTAGIVHLARIQADDEEMAMLAIAIAIAA